MRRLTIAIGFACLAATLASAQGARSGPATPSPVMVMETVKGTIEIQLFRSEAPKSVDHIIELVKKSFYRSQRFHRVEASLVQFGDPQSRDMTKIQSWGTGSSYNPIGVIELPKHLHVRGAVALAHSGSPKMADSQLYIMKAASPSLDGKHAVIGQVVKGMEVVDKLQKADLIKLVTIREAGQK